MGGPGVLGMYGGSGIRLVSGYHPQDSVGIVNFLDSSVFQERR